MLAFHGYHAAGGDGHCLVIPKTPARQLARMRARSSSLRSPRRPRTIARAAMKGFEADGITIQQFNEPAGGQVVFHLHVQRDPVVSTACPCVRIRVRWRIRRRLAEHAETLRKALG